MGNIQQVANLIENGADVNQQAGGGETPLHAASKRGNMAITVLLLLNKANPNIVDVFSV
jgi:ankyrin repeat protein